MRPLTIRFAIGSAVLLLVDILWVASSEITEYLYHEKKFNKPFFTAYCKSVMFVIYTLGFFFCDSWWSSYKSLSLSRLPDYYSSIADTDHQNLTMDEEDDDDDEEEEEEVVVVEESREGGEVGPGDDGAFSEVNIHQPNVSVNCNIDDIEPAKEASLVATVASPYIGEAIWMPIRHCSDTSSLSGRSETDDDESTSVDGDVIIENLNSSSTHNGRPGHKAPAGNNHKMLLIGSSNVNFKKKNKTKRKSKKVEESSLNSSTNDDAQKPRRYVRFSKLIEVRTLTDKHAEDAYVSRLSYSAFMRHIYHKTQQSLNASSDTSGSANSSSNSADFMYRGPKLNVKETALLAFYFTPIWFAANLSFHVGLQYSEAGMVNVLSSTTPLFTLLLCIIFPSGSSTDSISLTKLLGVLVFIASVALISSSEPINHSLQSITTFTSISSTTTTNSPDTGHGRFHFLSDSAMPLGSIWSLVGAFFYAVYIVLMRFNVVHDAMLNFPMFFGFIGLFSLILMWPIILLLNFTQLEIFDWPSKEQWLLILVNGLCGTVISELLWLWGSFMTSSLVGTIAVSFTIPLAISFDVFYKNIEYPRLWATVPMFFSFIIIILVSQYENWDPILATLEKCVRFIGVTSNESVGYRSAGNGAAEPDEPSQPSNHHHHHDQTRPQRHSTQTEQPATGSNSSSNSVVSLASSSGENNSRTSPPGSGGGAPPPVPTNKAMVMINNRRFDSKSYRSLKKSDNQANSSSALSSLSLFCDEDQEQSQSLIEAEDNAYA